MAGADELHENLPLTIPGVLDRAVEKFGAAEALVDGDLRLSWIELVEAIDRVTAALIATGVEHGDRVAIWAHNIAEWLLVAEAAYRCGAVVVPINTRFKGDEAAHILRTAEPRILFTVTDFLDTDYVELIRNVGELPSLEEIVVLSGPTAPDTTSWDAFLARGADIDPALVRARSDAVQPDDLSDILFTSGTTGAPKGAMYRHSATVRVMDSWASRIGLRADDRYLIVAPFFNAFGLKGGILASLITGSTMITHQVFDVPSVMRRITEERISMLTGPPAVFQMILDHPDLAQFDMSTLRLSVVGGAAIPVELIRRMRSELAFETVVTGYGLTESTGPATLCYPDDDAEVIAHTSGRPLPDIEVRIADEEGNTLPPGEPGEVQVHGYCVMKGYFNDPEGTAAAIDADGWLHTGDIGYIDDTGNLRITDRIKDMFIVGGFNAYPAEIENIMMNNPTVGQVAVIGVPDHRLGEVGAAYVIPRAGVSIDPDQLIAWCREHMANYKVPRRIEIRTELPLNPSGKVLKYQLREEASASAGEGRPSAAIG